MTSPLTLKRASASRPSGQRSDKDYDVLADGKVVGRILESGSRFDPPDLLWTWSITSIWPAMPRPPKKPTVTKLRRWRVSIMRTRAHGLGTVAAPDLRSAEAEAVKAFGLTEEQRRRLLILEWR
jgi:hypothetical protein